MFDLLADVEMKVASSATAMRDLKDHLSAAEYRQEKDPNAAPIVAACRLVSDLVADVKRCPYCGRDTKQEPTQPGCTKFATHGADREKLETVARPIEGVGELLEDMQRRALGTDRGVRS